VVLVISIFLLSWRETWVKVYIATLALALGYQGYILMAYTTLVAPQVPEREVDDPTRSFSLLSANIRMENRDAHSFLELVGQYSPDLVLVLEPDAWWIEQLRPLREQYSHYIEHPQDNYYGIALYSRLPPWTGFGRIP
jgi:endonuclease/exonuclease/phosphatase (EEP) superfamily protein YafD